MTAADLLTTLANAGMSLRLDGSRLIVANAERLTERQRDAIRAYKPDLVALLSGAIEAKTPDPPARCWRITEPDGACFSVTFCPPATRAEMERENPGALVEPLPDLPARHDAAPLHRDDAALVAAYLKAIGETDPETIAAFTAGLGSDPAGLDFIGQECVRLGIAEPIPAA